MGTILQDEGKQLLSVRADCPCPLDEEESRGEGSEDGAEGGEGVDLSHHISRLGKVMKRKLDYYRRNHSQDAGRDEKNKGGKNQYPHH